MTRVFSEVRRALSGETKTLAVLGVIVAISVGILAGLLHSVRYLYSSLDQVRSLSVDVQALSVDGELQYQIQESRIRFLHMMIPATSENDRLSDIARVRDADLKVTLLAGKAALLNSGLARLRPFTIAWERYDDIKDDMIALALQGRFADALAMEKAQGTAAFDAASEAIRGAKQQLELASSAKLDDVWSALRRACFELLGLLAASVIFIGALLAGEIKRRRILRRLFVATQTLRESEARFRSIFEEAAVGIVVTDLDGTIVSVNHAVEEFTLYSRHELTGQPVQVLMSDQHKDNSAKSVEALLRGDVPTYRAERQFCRKDGSSAWIRSSVSVARKDGHPASVIALCEDISEQKRAQEENTKLQSELNQAQKMESIGQLAAGIAHEINTPIQYIGDNGRFLEDAFRDLVKLAEARRECARDAVSVASGVPVPARERPDEGVFDYLRNEVPIAIEQLLGGVDQVARIVLAMKEFSHPGRVEKMPVDINRAIESTILVSKGEWKYLAELTTEFDPDLPPVPCLAGELNQVILNLIVNAAHAIADVVKDSGRMGNIRITTRRDGDAVEIRVGDTGCGIPKANQSKVFEPFFTTKPIGKGTGQGLAIAYGVVVQKHGGTIHLESEPGSGTTFIIRLPLVEELVAA